MRILYSHLLRTLASVLRANSCAERKSELCLSFSLLITSTGFADSFCSSTSFLLSLLSLSLASLLLL